jgi:hypothetical protein
VVAAAVRRRHGLPIGIKNYAAPWREAGALRWNTPV